jgi:glucokinase
MVIVKKGGSCQSVDKQTEQQIAALACILVGDDYHLTNFNWIINISKRIPDNR